MSTTIDERIVAMKFDNKDFERHAAESMDTLDLLKSKLNFEDVQKSLNTIDTSSIKREFENLGDLDTSRFEGVIDKLEYRMSNMGIFMARLVENVADSIYSIVDGIVGQIDRVISYAKDGIISGGISRAMNIESAKFNLEGLKIAWKDVSADIDYAVKDTAYSLDQAALIAAQLASSGIYPGYQYKTIAGEERDIDDFAMILRSISGAAAMSGGKAGYAELGNIFVKILSYGKANYEELKQIAGLTGINMQQTLADYFSEKGYRGKTDWEAEDIRDLTSSRSDYLDPMLVIEALYEKFGEHAVKANETLTGVMANTKAALSRIGANFFQPIIANGGPLVTLFDVLRRSINNLNSAISPVVKLMANDVVNALNKLTSPFIEKEYEYDEEGNVKVDELGNPIYKNKWKQVGGIFSEWLEPWKEAEKMEAEWDENHVTTGQAQKEYYRNYESRAEKFMKNMRSIFISTGKILSSFFGAIKAGFSAVFPGFKGWADIAVKLSGKIADVLESISNLPGLDGSLKFENTFMYKFFRGIFSGIDILFQFAKSFKEHIIDPIFGKAVNSIDDSGVGKGIKGLFDKLYDLDQMIKGTDDYFGPFMERLKDGMIAIKDFIVKHFGSIWPAIQNGFTKFIEFMKPVKDILFGTNASFFDKLKSVRDYFSENFSLPGWEKVSSVFTKVGDAIEYAFEKIRSLFGFGKSNNSLFDGGLPNIKEDANAQKFGVIGGSGIGNLSYYPGTITPSLELIANTIETMDKTTEKLPTVGDRISGFFSSVKESFDTTSLNGISTALTTFNIAVVVVIAVVAYAIFKLAQLAKRVIIDLPFLTQQIMQSFDDLLSSITETMRANSAEKYAEALHHIVVAVAIFSGLLLAMSVLAFVIKKFDTNKNFQKSMEEAGLMLITITGIMLGVIGALAFIASKMATSLSISKGAGLQLSSASRSLYAIQGIIQTLVFALIAVSALVIVLGVIPDWIYEEGINRITAISKLISNFIFTLIGIFAIFSVVSKVLPGLMDYKSLATSLMGVGAILSGIGLAITTIGIWIAIFGVLPSDWFDKGYSAMWKISGLLVGVIAAILIISGLTSKLGSISAPKIIAMLGGLSLVMAALTAATLAMAIAMRIMGDAKDLDGAKGALILIGTALTVIPAVLIAASAAFQKTHAVKIKDILALTGMMLGVAIATGIMASAIKMMSTIDEDKAKNSMLGLGLILGETAIIIGVLASMKNNKGLLTVMASIGGVFIGLFALAGAIKILGNLNEDELTDGCKRAAAMLAAIFVLGIAIDFVGGKLKLGNALKFTGEMALIALSILPLAVAAGVLIYAMKGSNLSGGDVAAIVGALSGVVIALGFTAALINKASQNLKGLGALASIATMVVMAASLIPVVVAMGLLLTVVQRTGIDPGTANIVMLGFAASVFLLALAASTIVKSTSGMAKLSRATLAKTVGMIGAVFAAMSVLVLSLAATVYIIMKSGASGWAVAGIVGVFLALAVIVGALTAFLTLISESQSFDTGKVTFTILMFAATAASLVLLAGVAGLLSTLDQGSLWSSVAVFLALGVIISGMVFVMKLISDRIMSLDAAPLQKTVITCIAMTGSLIALGLVAGHLSTLDQNELWSSVAVLGVLGTILSVMSFVAVALMKWMKDVKPAAMLGVMGTILTFSVSMIMLGKAMQTVKDQSWEELIGKLAVMAGAIIAVVVALTIAHSFISKADMLGGGGFASTCLSIAATLLAAGALFYLAGEGIKAGAEGIAILSDSFENAGKKEASIRKGMTVLGSGIGDSIVAMLNSLAEKMPQIHNALVGDGTASESGGIFGNMALTFTDGIRIVIDAIVDLLSDNAFMESIGGLLQKIVDIFFDYVVPAVGNFAERLATDVLVPIGKTIGDQLGESLWNAIEGDNYTEKVNLIIQESNKTLSDSLLKLISSWDGFDDDLAREILDSPEALQAIDDYNRRLLEVGFNQEDYDEFYRKMKEISDKKLELKEKAEKEAEEKRKNSESYYQARTAKNYAMETQEEYDEEYKYLERRYTELYGKIPEWALAAIRETWDGYTDDEKLAWLHEYIEMLKGDKGLNFDDKKSLVMDQMGEYGIDSTLAAMNPKNNSDLANDIDSTAKEATIGDSGIVTKMMNYLEKEGLVIKDGTSYKVKENVGSAIGNGLVHDLKDDGFISGATKYFSDKLLEDLKSKQYGFDINSPSKKTRKIGLSVVEGFTDGIYDSESDITNSAMSLTDAFTSSTSAMMADAGKSDAESYSDGFNEGIKGIGGSIKENVEKKIDFGELKSRVGLDKGLEENIAGFKSIWSDLKGVFTNESGDFDLGFLLEGIDIQDKLSSIIGLGDITSGFNMDGMSMGNFDMDLSIESIDMSKWENEFEGFDINDAISNDTLDLKLNIDTSAYDDFYTESSTGSLMSAIPATNGYAMSTTGSTYVNNYSYNQSITSTQPLSTREINRQTQRSLSRNRWNIGGGGGLRR